MFIPDMLFSVINKDTAVVLFPDRSGNVYKFGKETKFDPLSCETWKIALREVNALGVSPCAMLRENPDTGEVGWVILDKSLSVKEQTKLKQVVQKMTTLTFDPEKIAEDRQQVAILKYFVTKDKFEKLYNQSEEISQLENTQMRLLFSGIKPEAALPDTLLAEFKVIREQQEKTKDLMDDISKQAQEKQAETPEVYESMPLFDVLSINELREYCKQNNINSVPANAKKKEVFLKHIKKFYSAVTV